MSFESEILTSQAQALRHLPPNTYLETDQVEDELLLAQLLEINPALNPVQWLQETQAETCVKCLFWQLLDSLRRNLVGLKRTQAQANAAVSLAELEAGLGYRLNDQDLKLLKSLVYSHPLQADAETLLSIFWRLKRELIPLAASQFAKPDLELRAELLSLPPQTDPLKWLGENHPQYAAESTLRYLIHQVFPRSRRVAAERLPPGEFYPKFQKIACTFGGIVFYLSRFYTMHEVSAIELSFTIRKRQARHFDAKPAGDAGWRGIPALCDNLGHRYLIGFSGGELGVVFPLKWELRFAVYPAIVESAKTFTLSFDNVLLTVEERKIHGVHPEDDSHRYYELPLENLKWTVDIAALRRQFPGFY